MLSITDMLASKESTRAQIHSKSFFIDQYVPYYEVQLNLATLNTSRHLLRLFCAAKQHLWD